MIVRDARLVPVTPGRDVPDVPVDVLVERGRVVEVGPRLTRPDGVEEIEAGGRWLVPGLWDQHTHLGQWSLTSTRLDLSAADSPDHALDLVRFWLAEHPGRPLVGFGHRPAVWERQPTVAELDAVAGETPVVLIAGDAHHAWLSSSAQRALGLEVRDDTISENEWFAAYADLPGLVGNDGISPTGYLNSLHRAAAKGVVGVVDFEFGGGPSDWVERWTEGCDVLRVRVATYADRLDEVLAAGHRTGDLLLPGDDRLTMGPLKIISDGSLNTRTAWCCEPYADGGLGAANQSADELHALLARAHARGLEVATHAIGDAAVAHALSVYAATGARGSIEHAQLVARDDVRRMAAVAVRASVQPAHLIDDRVLTEQIWPGRSERCFAFRWMLDAGVPLALGSDAPVSPLDPWLAIAAAVHRGADDEGPWHAEQALTPGEALAASVDFQPTVGAGSRADLVLLERDPLAAGADAAEVARQLRSMPVALTVAAGRVVHSAL
ncbi:amidohydrolase family protein [Nocardioides sp. cx-169]|uniref:amidohydrolase n=1 Tax=Nocardioides sp. cx-169 TaxID=2899080 RepID=UPI001E2DF0AF|nr:amidohydrolase family protein [Nocardioides sp. cx-169]MCD4533307.1 amidohydrolase family protein [Nocardioides sp. cx-169]